MSTISTIGYYRMEPLEAILASEFLSDIDALKYLSSIHRFSYFDHLYSRFLKKDTGIDELGAIELARKWRDLEGITNFYHSLYSNVSEEYPGLKIYNYFSILETQKSLAKHLYDLNGLKMIFQNEKKICHFLLERASSHSHWFYSVRTILNFYSLFDNMLLTLKSLHPSKNLTEHTIECEHIKDCSFVEWLYGPSIETEDIELLISLNDTDSLLQINKHHKKNIKAEKYQGFLQQAYHREDLFFVEELLKLGFYFNPIYVFRPNPKKTQYDYVKHLKNLKDKSLIDESQYNQALSAVNAMYSAPLLSYYTKTCDPLKELGSRIYIDGIDAEEAKNALYYIVKQKFIVGDIVKYLICTNIHEIPLKLFFSNLKDTFFSQDKIISPYMDYFIQVNFSEESPSTIVHELTHAFLYILFDNYAKPYSKSDKDNFLFRFIAYKKSEYETFSKILNFLNPNIESDTSTLGLAKQIKINICTNVNKWVLDIKNQKYTNAEPLKKYTEKLAEIVYKHHNNPRVGCGSDIPNSDYKSSPVDFLIDFYKNLGWSDDESYLIYRVSGLLERKGDIEKNIEEELLVRVPELLVSVDKKIVDNLMSPLVKYWENHISPEVSNTINRYTEKYCTTESPKPCITECIAAIDVGEYDFSDYTIQQCNLQSYYEASLKGQCFYKGDE